MKAILSHPALYQAYQNAGGFFGARIKAIADYLTLRPGMRVIDIGCGPGHILRHLPEGIDYTGFDIDEAYIAYARRSFGHLGTFHCRHFDATAAREFAGADVVMMNGVLHHIADDGLQATLADIRDVLRSDGVLFTLDGCYREGKSRIAKWLLDNDRGEFVRDRDGYDQVLRRAFGKVNLAIRDQGWVLDFRRFRQYLEDKYGISKAFIFIGYINTNQNLYTSLQKDGYILVFKPTLNLPDGKAKGNVDAELVLHSMIEYPNYDKALIVSGDGDFYCLVDYLKRKDKLLKLMIPNRNRYSSLLRKFSQDIVFMNDLQGKLEYKKQ